MARSHTESEQLLWCDTVPHEPVGMVVYHLYMSYGVYHLYMSYDVYPSLHDHLYLNYGVYHLYTSYGVSFIHELFF